MTEPEFDYIVVGAGAAGCIVAARLSETGVSVLLLEAGGTDRGLVTRVPLLTFIASAAPEQNWSFETEPVPALDGRRQVWNQGRIVGGSGSVNGMIYMRGHPREYDAWREAGGESWSFERLLALYKRGEANSRGAGPWHGGDGPIAVRPSAIDLPLCDAFLAAATECGYPLVDDLNAGVDQGFGRFDCNIGAGVRMSSARAYLRPARKRRNLTVLTNALALRINIEAGRARGIELLQAGKRRTFLARREVVVSAGALNTPALLMASGIGPADHLKQLGIEPIVDLPEVGENLRNHPAYMQPYLSNAPVSAYAYLSPWRGAGAVIDYLVRRKGPLAESFSGIGGFIRSDPSVDLADTIVIFVPSLIRRASGSHPRWWDLLPREHGFFTGVALGRTRSVGRVRLRSATPGDTPRIFPNFFDDPRDLAALARSVVQVNEIMRRPAIARYIDAARSKPLGDDLQTVTHNIRAAAGSFSHPMGTCRMGRDPNAVVDPDLRVNGVTGLRVADNSIIPGPLNACTHAPALLIGEQAAALMTGTG